MQVDHYSGSCENPESLNISKYAEITEYAGRNITQYAGKSRNMPAGILKITEWFSMQDSVIHARGMLRKVKIHEPQAIACVLFAIFHYYMLQSKQSNRYSIIRYDVGGCAICVSNKVKYLDKEGSYILNSTTEVV